ncbi:MAG TPA: hypothetical protein VG204_13115 [Terriglobia bacterium]|nr:hypothetical protein [Terriglobia bacterium]
MSTWRVQFVRQQSGAMLALVLLLVLATARPLVAAEGPYFLTYDHHLEDPGDLEVSFSPVFGFPRTVSRFAGASTEFEYGASRWWTTEFYLDGQTTWRDATVFTGFRWENRFRPLQGEHWINPVLYVEFENINGADKSLLEVVGHDTEEDFVAPAGLARVVKEREIETKLILSSDFKRWNISENFIAEKNLTNVPWEFGYTMGVSRPLGFAASPLACNFCRKNFSVGAELYGGLGDRYEFGFHRTSQYAGPLMTWALSNGTTFKFSPMFGMTRDSHRALLRFSVSYEIERFDRRVQWLFR